MAVDIEGVMKFGLVKFHDTEALSSHRIACRSANASMNYHNYNQPANQDFVPPFKNDFLNVLNKPQKNEINMNNSKVIQDAIICLTHMLKENDKSMSNLKMPETITSNEHHLVVHNQVGSIDANQIESNFESKVSSSC